MNILNKRRKLRQVYRKHYHQRIKGRKKFLIDIRSYKSYKAKKEFESVVLKDTNEAKQRSKKYIINTADDRETE
jgi:hypothetical protein